MEVLAGALAHGRASVLGGVGVATARFARLSGDTPAPAAARRGRRGLWGRAMKAKLPWAGSSRQFARARRRVRRGRRWFGARARFGGAAEEAGRRGGARRRVGARPCIGASVPARRCRRRFVEVARASALGARFGGADEGGGSTRRCSPAPRVHGRASAHSPSYLGANAAPGGTEIKRSNKSKKTLH